MTSPAPDVWPAILTDYTYDSELDNADGVPHSVSTQRLVPSGNQGYIRNLGRFGIPEPLPMHTGINRRKVYLLIRFSAEERRMCPWQPVMV